MTKIPALSCLTAEAPPTLKWLNELNISSTETISEQALNIIPTTKEDKKKNDIKLLADKIPADISANISRHLQKCGWAGSGSHFLEIDGHQFLLVGTTTHDVSDKQKARQVGLEAAAFLKNFKFKQLAVCSGKLNELDVFDGIVMGFYSMKFKDTPAGKKDEDSDSKFPSSLALLTDEKEPDISRSRNLARAVLLSRMLQDSPPNWLDSEKLAELVAKICEDLPIKYKALGREEMEALGMGSFLSVAKGTHRDPKMIVMEVTGRDSSRTIALAGKGVTFDSGGISLKPSTAMADMKYDMSGAASVVGAMVYLAQEQPAVNVVGIVGAVENMPSSHATRPSDIVTAMNGLSIEVLNTDAEGRLVLADVLCYAVENYKPCLIIDIATLTGAALYATGSCGAALMTNNQAAADFVLKNSSAVGEPFWQLPMWAELKKEVKGDCSDLKNITASNVKAGTITAACFLERFVGTTPWVHLDIAGTAYSCKATGFPSKGSCGYGLRTLAEVCHTFSEDFPASKPLANDE